MGWGAASRDNIPALGSYQLPTSTSTTQRNTEALCVLWGLLGPTQLESPDYRQM